MMMRSPSAAGGRERLQCIVSVMLCLLVVRMRAAMSSQLADCELPETETLGRCTPIHECAPVMQLLNTTVRPLPHHVVNYLQTLTCGYDRDGPIVCCALDVAVPPNPNNTSNSTTTRPPTTLTPITTPSSSTTNYTEVVTTTVLDIDARVGIDPESIADHANLRLLSPIDCGIIQTQKISSGNDTDLSEYPWMVQLQYRHRSGELRFQCGGTLINEWYVLTAAHCVQNLVSSRLVSVRLGEYDVDTDPDCEIVDGEQECADPVQDIAIDEVVSHPNYNRPRFSNDIALIRLAARANLQPENVRTICLPITNDLLMTLPKIVSISGWGLTENQTVSSRLLQASLPIIGNGDCQQAYGSRVQLHATQLCAGGERGVDSCKGDSGGPLFYPANVRTTQMVQFGVISLGVATCSTNTLLPGIYTRVAHYMKWILDNMRE